MITINRIDKTSATEVMIGNKLVLYSYSTAVAFKFTNGKQTVNGIATEAVRTNKKWSVTTSKHINKWLKDHDICGELEVSQDELEGLLS